MNKVLLLENNFTQKSQKRYNETLFTPMCNSESLGNSKHSFNEYKSYINDSQKSILERICLGPSELLM